MLAVDSLSRGAVQPARGVLFLDGVRYNPEKLPFPLAVLAGRGVEIVCLNKSDGSCKKLSLFAWYPHPDQMPMITIDDDVRYPTGWLHGFQAETVGGGSDILCYRARRIALDEAGAFAPYQHWEFVRGGEAGYDVLPNGAYGVLSTGMLWKRLGARGWPSASWRRMPTTCGSGCARWSRTSSRGW